MFVNGRLVPGDIYEGLDRLLSSKVVESGKEGVRTEGSLELVNGLSDHTVDSNPGGDLPPKIRPRHRTIFSG